MLQKVRKNKPSEMVTPFYRRIFSKYLEFYIIDDAKKKQLKKDVFDQVEIWKRNKNFKRLKSFYFTNVANFGDIYDTHETLIDSSNLFNDFTGDKIHSIIRMGLVYFV